MKYKYALVSHCVTMIYTLLLYFAGFLSTKPTFICLFIYLFIYLFFFWGGGGRYVILKQRLY